MKSPPALFLTTESTYPAVLALLALATLACYFNALNGVFQFDDYNVIVDNPGVHDWHAWWAGLGHGIRPMLKFTYTLDWTLGMGAPGFHVTNLLIHLANSFLVFLLARQFVQQQAQRYTLRNVPLVTAILFAVHPVHTEGVSYISGRSVSLMTLFYLAGVLVYLNGRLQRKQMFTLMIAPLLFLLALGAKETAVTFPLALLAWELCCGGNWQAELKPQWPSWAVLLIAVMWFLFSDSYVAQMQRSADLNSLQGNIATQLLGFAWLMQQWTAPFNLNIDPDLPLLHNLGQAVLPLLFFLVLVVLAIYCRRKKPWITFALAWTIIQLIPLYLLMPRLDVANDRQLYIVSGPLLLAVVIELTLWLRKPAFHTGVALILVLLAALTIQRNRDFASEISLWEDTASKSPAKARVHNNLGFAYQLDRRVNDARREFSLALQLDPTMSQARHNLQTLDAGATMTQSRP